IETRPASTAARQPVTQGEYRVRPGDTLYSIATRHGWDWRALAERNGIPAPYTIRVGQLIRFSGSAVAAPVASAAPRASAGGRAATTAAARPPVSTAGAAAASASTALASGTPGVVSSGGWTW